MSRRGETPFMQKFGHITFVVEIALTHFDGIRSCEIIGLFVDFPTESKTYLVTLHVSRKTRANDGRINVLRPTSLNGCGRQLSTVRVLRSR